MGEDKTATRWEKTMRTLREGMGGDRAELPVEEAALAASQQAAWSPRAPVARS